MMPGARLQAVIDLLNAIHEGTAPADRAVAAFFRARRYVGAKDRRSVMDLCYAVLRSQARLDWWIARSKASLGQRERARLIAHLVIVEGWGADKIAGSFDGGRYRPDRLEEGERRLAKALAGEKLDHGDQPVSVRFEFPAWIERRIRARFGPELETEMAATLRPAATDLRANTLKATRAEALAALRAEGVDAALTDLSPVGLRVLARPALAGLNVFRNGLVEVQDEGSQLVALLVDAKPGNRVVDFCAGAGGKTLAIAAGMANKGRIIACDVLEGRVERASVRLSRAGVHNVERRGFTSERDQWVKRHLGEFDRVLVDAPCTGTGTWRRNPDARWRLRAQDVAELVALQRRILESAQRLVKISGRLIYATCSFLTEENDEQVAWFLGVHPKFRVVPIANVWRETVGGECPSQGDYLELTPARHGTDGFFAAVLERNAA
jgi:16S rRNA (cytosine967-C5)-methyltransferase